TLELGHAKFHGLVYGGFHGFADVGFLESADIAAEIPVGQADADGVAFDLTHDFFRGLYLAGGGIDNVDNGIDFRRLGAPADPDAGKADAAATAFGAILEIGNLAFDQ